MTRGRCALAPRDRASESVLNTRWIPAERRAGRLGQDAPARCQLSSPPGVDLPSRGPRAGAGVHRRHVGSRYPARVRSGTQDGAHRGRRDPYAELAALADDAHVSPAGVLPGQAQHEINHLGLQVATASTNGRLLITRLAAVATYAWGRRITHPPGPALRYRQGAETRIEQSASAGLAMVCTQPMNPGRYQCRSLSPLKTPTPRMSTHQPRPRPRPKPKPTSLPFTQIGLPDARRARRHHSLNRMERASAPAAGARSRVRASGVPAVAADPLAVRSSAHGSRCPRRCGGGGEAEGSSGMLRTALNGCQRG
jgi:hypothetical protein